MYTDCFIRKNSELLIPVFEQLEYDYRPVATIPKSDIDTQGTLDTFAAWPYTIYVYDRAWNLRSGSMGYRDLYRQIVVPIGNDTGLGVIDIPFLASGLQAYTEDRKRLSPKYKMNTARDDDSYCGEHCLWCSCAIPNVRPLSITSRILLFRQDYIRRYSQYTAHDPITDMCAGRVGRVSRGRRHSADPVGVMTYYNFRNKVGYPLPLSTTPWIPSPEVYMETHLDLSAKSILALGLETTAVISSIYQRYPVDAIVLNDDSCSIIATSLAMPLAKLRTIAAKLVEKKILYPNMDTPTYSFNASALHKEITLALTATDRSYWYIHNIEPVVSPSLSYMVL